MFLIKDRHQKPLLLVVIVGEEISVEHITLRQILIRVELETLHYSF